MYSDGLHPLDYLESKVMIKVEGSVDDLYRGRIRRFTSFDIFLELWEPPINLHTVERLLK